VLGMPVHNEMCVRGQNDLVKLAVHNALPFKSRKAMTDILAGFVERLFFDNAFVVVDINWRVWDHNSGFDA